MRRGKVRIYAMEEVIRLVEKSTAKLQTLYEPPPLGKPPAEIPLPASTQPTRSPSPLVDSTDHQRDYSEGSAMDLEEDAAT